MAGNSAGLDSNVRWTRAVKSALVTGAAFLGMALLIGCGSENDPGIGDGNGVGGYPNDDAGVVACEDGTSKKCVVYVGESSNVVSCYEGIQFCQDGVFGPCQDGTVVKRLRPPPGSMKTMSLSDAGSCEDNPCDPSCQVFDEEPDGGLGLDSSVVGPDWVTADIKDLEEANWPPGLFRKGLNEPCFSNMDCQYDQYCYEPLTNAACEHSKCATGAGLTSTCDECVSAVCDVMPSCCGAGGGGSTPTGVLFEESFTNLNAQGWSLAGEWEIGVASAGNYDDPGTDTTATSDNQLAGTDIGSRYDNNANYSLTSPTIDTTGTGMLALSLRSWERLEPGWDYGYVRVSTNNGSTWTTIYSTSGNESTWKTLKFDISAYRSTQFKLSFQFTSDGSIQNGGWSLDDIVIMNVPTLFQETFSNLNAQGWSLTGEWEIGAAAAGSNDPSTDTTLTSDNRLAGIDIGGGYSDNANYLMTSPTIDTSGSGALTLSLRSWERLEPSWDYGYIKVSTNNGSNWTTIYTTSDSNSTWKALEFDLSAYRSAQFKLLFQFTSDGSVTDGGWSLDDIYIGGASCQAEGESCSGETCCPGSSCVGGVCAPPWSADCIAKVGEVCGSFCPMTGTCGHDICLAGGPLAATCDPCVASICAVDPGCCNGEWDNYCISKVGSLCGQNCNSEAGECRQYSPYETNPYCTALPDLTAGVPCGNTVPICNRGATTVAANTASFFYFPGLSANDNTFTTCDVSTSLQNTAKQCPIPVAIPPGECRSISCAELGNNGGIVVNPLPLSNYPSYAPIDECTCQNNWSLFRKPATGDPPCGAPACQSSSISATIPNVNMYLMFDKSGSMAGNRWNLTTAALRGFIRDPASAGLRVGLRFFPGTVSSSECGEYTCTDQGCKVPQVGLGTLLAGQVTDTTCGSMPNNCSTTADPQECELVKAIRCTSASGWTPLLVALGGATSYMGDHAWNYPTERSVVVLVTDGYPEGGNGYPADCRSPADNLFVTKAQNAFNSYGVVTYTANVVGGDANLMQDIATAGHGDYFYISDSNATAELVAALNQIRSNSVSCDLLLDTSAGLDPNEVAVTFTDSSNTSSNFDKRPAGQVCGTANNWWYFDDDVTPTKITLCPDACARVRSDINSKLELVVGCPTTFQPVTHRFEYSGTCAPGKAVQWGQLTWSATTPGNSSITFQARTSNDIATFSAPAGPGELTDLGVAHDAVAPYTNDLQECDMFGPTPDCPVDAYMKLGLPDAMLSHLELNVTLTPSTTGASTAPELHDWGLTYSCVDSE